MRSVIRKNVGQGLILSSGISLDHWKPGEWTVSVGIVPPPGQDIRNANLISREFKTILRVG